jgi:outer membrane lipoprotein SlyB
MWTWTKLAMLTPALLLAGCYTTTTYSRTIDGGGYAPALEGRVEDVHEIVRRTEGSPAGGAVGGAIIGGLLGGAITGRPLGAVVGAAGGAATGAAVSQGSSEQRWYEVVVRFDDGSVGRITYRNPPPWRIGDRVRQSPSGLVAAGERPERTPRGEAPRWTPPPPPAGIPPPPS